MQSKANHNLLKANSRGFTMVEVAAATLILAMVLSSVMFLMNRYLDAVVDMRLQRRAFEVARANMETLLSGSEVSDMSDSGESEEYPDIQWETVVEPFTEPVKDRMWIRAACSANYTDSKGEFQEVELEHWITSLTAAQIKQILNQKEVMGEYYDLIKEGYMTDAQLATMAYLEQAGLDVTAYKELVEQHRRDKLQYLQDFSANFDERKFDKFVEELDEEENDFLEKLGMDFDEYNDFASTYEPPEREGESEDPYEEDSEEEEPEPDEEEPFDCSKLKWHTFDKSLWQVVEELTGCPAPN